jgi:hypothetical protein
VISPRWRAARGESPRRAPTLLALATAALACAGSPVAPGAQVLARLDAAAPAGPGQLAWSPDGEQLALARPDGLLLLDVERGSTRLLPGAPALTVDWAPAAELLLVEREGAATRAVALDPATGQRRTLHADPALASARWLHGGPEWLAVTARREVVSFGTEVRLGLLRGAGGKVATLHSWDDTLPTRDPSVDATGGWLAAVPNPVDHRLVVPVFHKPPIFSPHLRFVSIDPFDPAPVELGRVEAGLWTAAASWAPDGRRLAFAAADGSLRLLHLDGRIEAPAGPARGRHPSFGPRDDVLFLGGWLVTARGEPLRQLLAGAPGASGLWSPDGHRLAVVDGGRIFVFGGLGGAAPAEAAARRERAREALWRLGELRRAELLERRPYRQQRELLLRQLVEVVE